MNEITTTATELPWLWAGLGAYAVATFIAVRSVMMTGQSAGAALNRSYENQVFLFIIGGVVLLAAALADRWLRIGHGPFVNLFELLMSQLFSLGVIYGIAYWRFPVIRPSAAVALPMMWILGIWILLLQPVDAPFPPTYSNNWLWVHVGMGKIFLGLSMVGTALSGIILLRTNQRMAVASLVRGLLQGDGILSGLKVLALAQTVFLDGHATLQETKAVQAHATTHTAGATVRRHRTVMTDTLLQESCTYFRQAGTRGSHPSEPN